jgi:hypothetical protein
MSIAQSILANPSKYSLAQLRQGVENGVIPAYIGIPIIQEKMQEQARMQSMGQGQGQPAQPPVAEQIMAQAGQGVESLQSNLPQEYAGGGIVAFEEGGQVERFQTGGTQEERDREAIQDVLSRLGAAGKDVVSLPYRAAAGAAESVVTRPLRAMGVPIPYLPEGFYGGDVSSMTPYMDALKKQRGEAAPATASGINKDLGPVPGSTDKDVLGGRPMGGGITALPNAGRKPAAAGPGAGPAGGMGIGQGPLNLPPDPVRKSAEDFARTQFRELNERSDKRIDDLIAAQSKNKMEGKAFDGLKKTLEDEAAQAGVEKSSAKNMAIFKAGLAMMGGTSRNALENIGKGAMVGAEDYQKAAADLKKADKERQKQFAAIEEARRAEERDDIKTKNSYLEKAYTAKQRGDELGAAAISAGFGVDDAKGMDMWKTKYSGATTIGAALIGERSAKYTADRAADSRLQAAELRASLAGLGGGKGALTQDQLIKNRQTIAESPQIAEYKKQLIAEYGKNVVNQPRFQENVNKRIDQLLVQMLTPPGAGGTTDVLGSYLAQNPSLAQYFKR